jgi:predicted RNA-binding Zn ribbon-like protein
MNTPAIAPPAGAPPLLLADHLALDFLNTLAIVDGHWTDWLQSDDDVIRWLELAGQPTLAGAPMKALVREARSLRELIRGAVGQRKREEPVDVSDLNACLRKLPSCRELRIEAGGVLAADRVPYLSNAAQWLAPIAEAGVDLLVNADFALVRQCEHPECVLWFYDRTKAHKRRWCSMALCGNRHKVAAYRQRHS